MSGVLLGAVAGVVLFLAFIGLVTIVFEALDWRDERRGGGR